VNVRDGRIAYAGAALLILATVVGGCSGGSGQQTPAAITINATVGNQVVPLPLKILIQN
jgi:hypothetical protein